MLQKEIVFSKAFQLQAGEEAEIVDLKYVFFFYIGMFFSL